MPLGLDEQRIRASMPAYLEQRIDDASFELLFTGAMQCRKANEARGNRGSLNDLYESLKVVAQHQNSLEEVKPVLGMLEFYRRCYGDSQGFDEFFGDMNVARAARARSRGATATTPTTPPPDVIENVYTILMALSSDDFVELFTMAVFLLRRAEIGKSRPDEPATISTLERIVSSTNKGDVRAKLAALGVFRIGYGDAAGPHEKPQSVVCCDVVKRHDSDKSETWLPLARLDHRSLRRPLVAAGPGRTSRKSEGEQGLLRRSGKIAHVLEVRGRNRVGGYELHRAAPAPRNVSPTSRPRFGKPVDQ